jgi:hypothetical protein
MYEENMAYTNKEILTTKKNEIMLFAGKWMELEICGEQIMRSL